MVKVAQCWDDGVATDIRLTEILRKYNAKATFNLCPGLMPDDKTAAAGWTPIEGRNWSVNGFSGGRICKKELKSVYGDFQVASHCWKHEVAGVVPDDVFLQSAMDARNFLEDIFQRPCRGFAWPGGRHTPETELLLSKSGFLYGRTVESTPDVTGNKKRLALAANCHFMSRSFWKIFENAKNTGVFYFWGHSHEMTDCPQYWERFEMLIKNLSEDPEVEWIDVSEIPEILANGDNSAEKSE